MNANFVVMASLCAASKSRGRGKMLPCLQNPTAHYCGGSPEYSLISGNPLTWIDKGTTKSMYDPCPYGYRVPINGSWAGFTSKTWTNGTINEGQIWQLTWLPASGWRYCGSANLALIAYNANNWSSSPSSSTDGYALGFDYNGFVYPSYSYSRSYGLSLRCVQE